MNTSDIPQSIMDEAHMVWQRANTEGNIFTGDGKRIKIYPRHRQSHHGRNRSLSKAM